MIKLLLTDTQKAHHDEQDYSEQERTEPDDLRTEDVPAVLLFVSISHADLQVHLQQPEPDQDYPHVGDLFERKAHPPVENAHPTAVLLFRALEFHHVHYYFARA